MNVSIEPAVLVGFCLVLVRATAWTMICPPFNAPAIPLRVRGGFAVGIAFLLAKQMGAQVQSFTTASLIVSLVTQMIAGFALGFVIFALFSVVQTAGELIDLQVGFSMGAVLDPLSGNNSTPIGRFHQLLGLAMLFAINGHVIIVRAFLRSVQVAPLGHINTAALASALTKIVGMLVGAAIEIALPILAALFCSELAIGFLGKAAPQLNLMVIGFAVKTLIAFGLLATMFSMLPESVDSLVGQGIRTALSVFRG